VVGGRYRLDSRRARPGASPEQGGIGVEEMRDEENDQRDPDEDENGAYEPLPQIDREVPEGDRSSPLG